METLLRPTSERDKLSLLVMASTAIHLFLFIIFYWFGQIQLPEFLMSTKDINIKLAKASVRVDLVKMPTLTIKELKTLRQLESSGGKQKPIVEKKEVVTDENAFIKKKKKQDFMSLLKNLSERQVETKVKKVDKKETKNKGPSGPKISGAMRGKLKKLLIAGNKLGSGTAIVGSGDAEAQGALDRYATMLPEHVRPNWKLPSYLINKDLTCRVKLYLAPDGDLIKAEIFESSGDDEYDARALGAVKSSTPFPALPDEIATHGGRGSIVLGFPL